jgi:hypothetical protein
MSYAVSNKELDGALDRIMRFIKGLIAAREG